MFPSIVVLTSCPKVMNRSPLKLWKICWRKGIVGGKDTTCTIKFISDFVEQLVSVSESATHSSTVRSYASSLSLLPPTTSGLASDYSLHQLKSNNFASVCSVSYKETGVSHRIQIWYPPCNIGVHKDHFPRLEHCYEKGRD